MPPFISILLAAASGILLVLAYPPFGESWLIWIALIPALLGLHLDPASSTRPLKAWRTWIPAFLLGIICFGGLFWWIGEVTVLGTVLLCLYLAFYPALWLLYAARRWPRQAPYTSYGILRTGIELASLWIVLEWLRGWLFGGFGWNGLGVALSTNLPLLQAARFGGVLGLSWIVALANVVGALTLVRLYHEARGRQKLRAHVDFSLVMVALALLLVTGWHHLWRVPSGTPRHLRYVLVQPNIPQEITDSFPPAESLRRHLDLTAQAVLLQPDLIVWPESPVGIDLTLDRPAHDALYQLMANADFSLLAGSLHIVEGQVFNSALLFDPHDGGLHIYDKNKLVPFGEYVPFARELPILRKLVPFQIDFSGGDHPRMMTLQNGVRLLPLICYEDTLADYARRGAQLDPDVLVNITNDGWFRRSPGTAQHLANAVFRTVELDRPLLCCSNTGISAVVDATGRITSELAVGKRNVDISGILSGDLQWYPAEQTPYALYGDWFVWLAAAVVLWRPLRDKMTPKTKIELQPELPEPPEAPESP